MMEECQCGNSCPLCEGCGLPECECKCDNDIEMNDDEALNDMEW